MTDGDRIAELEAGYEIQMRNLDAAEKVIAALSSIPPTVAAIIAKWQTAGHMQLHAGEMSAQQIRSMRAVLKAMEAEVMALLPPTNEQTVGK